MPTTPIKKAENLIGKRIPAHLHLETAEKSRHSGILVFDRLERNESPAF